MGEFHASPQGGYVVVSEAEHAPEFDATGRRVIREGPEAGRVRSGIDPQWTEPARREEQA